MATSRMARAIFFFCCAMLCGNLAFAQNFPSRPIKLLVGFAPGGGTDTLARIYAQKLQELLGVAVIVENKPGANELLAALPVKSARPDGYTLWVATNSAMAQSPGLRSDLPYDTLRDFSLIASITNVEAILVVKNALPVHSVADLITYAKANPGKLNFGSAGTGSGSHLIGELIKGTTGVDMVHIPFKSAADLVREVSAGTVDFGVSLAGVTLPFVVAGRLRAIGVTGDERIKELPVVEPLGQGGVLQLKQVGSFSSYGLLGPAGMKAEDIQMLNEAMNKISRMPGVRQQLERLYYTPTPGSPSSFRQRIEDDIAKWRQLSKTIKLSGS